MSNLRERLDNVATGLPTWVCMSARIRDDGTVILGVRGTQADKQYRGEIEHGQAVDAVMGLDGSASWSFVPRSKT